jgi:hypothetical protein
MQLLELWRHSVCAPEKFAGKFDDFAIARMPQRLASRNMQRKFRALPPQIGNKPLFGFGGAHHQNFFEIPKIVGDGLEKSGVTMGVTGTYNAGFVVNVGIAVTMNCLNGPIRIVHIEADDLGEPIIQPDYRMVFHDRILYGLT